MARLPPAEKLPLAVRKNIRDDWDNRKADLEKQLSEKLGTAWTIDVNPLALFPYAASDWTKTSLGSVIYAYVDAAIGNLGSFASRQGEAGVGELNTVASAHVLTLDVDEAGANSYCGCAIQEGGRLAILFNASNMGTNVDEAVHSDKLLKVLNEAPKAAGSLSFAARTSIRNNYDAKAGEIRSRIGQLLQRDDIQLVPNFEANYATLSTASPAVDSYKYEEQLGGFAAEYFDGVARSLDAKSFGTDEMLREGFNEAVETGTIALRIVDALTYGSYCEVVVEDGTLFVQTTAARFGVNISDAAEKIIDQL